MHILILNLQPVRGGIRIKLELLQALVRPSRLDGMNDALHIVYHEERPQPLSRLPAGSGPLE